MKICIPTVERAALSARAAHQGPGSLTGKTVGLLTNVWPSYQKMLATFQDRLLDSHRVAHVKQYEIPRTRAAPEALLQQVADECDVAIVGLGN